MKQNTLISITAIILLVLIISSAIYLIYSQKVEKGGGEVFVYEVIDGDTFKMSDGTKVRLLCVNTPEIGDEGSNRATKFLESLVLYKAVRLEEGESLDKVDKYDRDLRFVHVDNMGTDVFVNAEIVRLGFGELYDYRDPEKECRAKLGAGI